MVVINFFAKKTFVLLVKWKQICSRWQQCANQQHSDHAVVL